MPDAVIGNDGGGAFVNLRSERLHMKRPNRGCIVFLLAGVLGAAGGTAWADDAKPAEAPMAAPRKFTGDQQAFFIAGSVADSPTWTIGTTLPAGVAISV